MKTLDMSGNSHDWLVEQGRSLQQLPRNDDAVFHAAYWERQHDRPPLVGLHNVARPNLRRR